MDQIINLDRDDDILKVRSQVEWSDGRRVLLVAPRGARAFESEYELRLLHRWADDADVMVALISDDINVRERARAADIPVFPSVGRAQRVRWKWKRNSADGIVRSTALDEAEPGPRKPILDRLGLVGAQLVFTLILFAVSMAILGTVALFLIPSARITVYPASLVVSDGREVILDPTINTIDQINGLLPATPFRREISGTATIATTKVDTAPADYAAGQVIFTNLAGAKATIPVGTIVETSSGVTVRYSTTAPAELPEGYNARVSVPVRAVEPGPGGNVKALQINTIEGPLGAVARVINTDALSGGGIKQVHLVSLDDKTRLRDQLSNQLRAAAVARIQKEAGSDTFIAPASVDVSILNESFDHLVDDPSDTLSLHVEAVATGMAVDRADLEKFAQQLLMAKVPKGYTVLPDTLRIDPDTNARVEGNDVIFTLRSAFQITPQVNSGELLKGLNGKTKAEAESLIGQRIKLAQPPKFEMSPDWWPRMPFFGFRLALFVRSEAQLQAQGAPGTSGQ